MSESMIQQVPPVNKVIHGKKVLRPIAIPLLIARVISNVTTGEKQRSRNKADNIWSDTNGAEKTWFYKKKCKIYWKT